MDVFEVIRTKRSVKKYLDKLLRILEITGHSFLTVASFEAKRRLGIVCPQNWFVNTHIIIVTCVNPIGNKGSVADHKPLNEIVGYEYW